MACKNVCKLCKRLILSSNVYYVGGVGLVINLPAGTYINGEKYCIVVTQAIPADTPYNAPVVIRIGATTTNYPLARCDCSQATVCNIRTRTKYSTRLVTSGTGATFRLLGKTCCAPDDSLAVISG